MADRDSEFLQAEKVKYKRFRRRAVVSIVLVLLAVAALSLYAQSLSKANRDLTLGHTSLSQSNQQLQDERNFLEEKNRQLVHEVADTIESLNQVLVSKEDTIENVKHVLTTREDSITRLLNVIDTLPVYPPPRLVGVQVEDSLDRFSGFAAVKVVSDPDSLPTVNLNDLFLRPIPMTLGVACGKDDEPAIALGRPAWWDPNVEDVEFDSDLCKVAVQEIKFEGHKPLDFQTGDVIAIGGAAAIAATITFAIFEIVK